MNNLSNIDEERSRIHQQLATTEVGTKEYAALLDNLDTLVTIEAKIQTSDRELLKYSEESVISEKKLRLEAERVENDRIAKHREHTDRLIESILNVSAYAGATAFAVWIEKYGDIIIPKVAQMALKAFKPHR